MEVKEKSKKRELIKTIAIVFLAVLLVLTFFSGTIMNYSLPEVATQLVASGTINAKIRGSGTLAANESYEVMLDQTREIRSVCVKEGDTVEEGTLLFVLGDVESEELKAAQEALEKARISYQEQVLNFSKEYATDDQNVKTIREDLEKAIKERDENFVTDEEVTFAKGDLASMEANKRSTDFTLSELKALQTESSEYTEAKAEVDTLKSTVNTLTTKVEDCEDRLNKLDIGVDESISRQLSDARTALSKAQTTWESDWLAYSGDLNDLIKAMNTSSPSYGTVSESKYAGSSPLSIEYTDQRYLAAFLTTLEGTVQKPSSSDKSPQVEAQTESQIDYSAYLKYETAYSKLIADQEDVAAKQAAVSRLEKDQTNASNSSGREWQQIRDELSKAQSDLSVAQRQLRDAQQRLDTATSANTQLKEQINAWEATQREQEAAITELKTKVADLEAKQTAYKSAVAEVEKQQRALETSMTGDGIDKQLNNLTLQSMSIEIRKQEELVEKYQKDAVGAEVKAPVSGVIRSINVTSGKKTDPSSPLAVIDVVDRGYTIKIPVTNDQAKQVKVGDTAEVTNFYWGNDITATLESIAPDPESSGQKKLLVFRVSGDIDAGTNISLSIGQRSATFDAIVPKSAIRQDSNGKFVLVVTAKSTPLGNRYTATRADVQVLAEDDTSAAVSGLAANDYVITTSSKPLDPGSQVRMVENP